jgi:hypothetical protein
MHKVVHYIQLYIFCINIFTKTEFLKFQWRIPSFGIGALTNQQWIYPRCVPDETFLVIIKHSF